ncbi:MAG: response regulator [Deltaproteobacteria bacterium]|nr:response regulator [Deltaproteobacteria bacterium]
MRALVIDDSKSMRLIVKRQLVTLGFDVVEAIHGRDGLAKLEADATIAVALVDWNMPEMNGLEFVQAVRADPRYQNLPMVMVTTEAESERVVQALDAGASEYVMKPFTPDDLRSKLELLALVP